MQMSFAVFICMCQLDPLVPISIYLTNEANALNAGDNE